MSKSKGNKYWHDRLIAEADKRKLSEKLVQKELTEIYSFTNNQIQKEIDGFIGRYAAGRKLNRADLKRAVSMVDIKALEDKARHYVKTLDFSPRANTEMKAYNMKMRMSRLEYLRAQIDIELIAGFGKEEKYANSLFNLAAMQTFKEQMGILSMTIPEPAVLQSTIQAIVNTPYKGAFWSDRIWKRQRILQRLVAEKTKDTALLGINPTRYVKELTDIFEVNAYEARRLLVTEATRIQTEVSKYNYERYDIEQFVFLAESSACDICLDLNNQVFDVKNMLPGENAAPIHPHCHCTVAPHYDREAWEKEQDEKDRELEKPIMLSSDIVKDIALKVEVLRSIKKEYPFLKKSNVRLRRERLNHIIEGHSDIGENIPDVLENVVSNPKYILVDSKSENTVIAVKTDNVNNINVIVKLSTDKQLDNSIITAHRVSEKKLKKLLNKLKIIYNE